MRQDAGMLPEWPVAYPTRDEAIAAALAIAEPGDIVWVHQDGCATRHYDDCDCVVQLVPVSGVVQ